MTDLAPLAPPRWLSRRSGFAVVGLCMAGFIAGEILALILAVLGHSLSGTSLSLTTISHMASPPPWFLVTSLFGLWMGFGGTTLVAQKVFRIFPDRGVFAFRVKDLWFILLGVGCQFAVGLAYYPFHLHNLNGPTHKIFGDAHGAMFALLCLLTAFGAPIFEELFFRGTLLCGLTNLIANPPVVVLSLLAISLDGILFGLAHGELLQLPGLAATGIVLAFVYAKTRRMLPNMITHASFNSMAVLALIAQRAHG